MDEIDPHESPANRLTEEIEWLEADGLGGFATGTATGVRTRRYHALLVTATTEGRFVLVNGLEAWIETEAGRFDLSSQRYLPDVIYPDGERHLQTFSDEPWPTWRWRLADGHEVALELCVPQEISACVLRWRISGAGAAKLFVRPLLSGRDYHQLHHENSPFRFEPRIQADAVTWKPYDNVPATTALSNGAYRHDPDWFRHFLYTGERERGLDDVEDQASPGVFSWDLREEAVLIFSAEGNAGPFTPYGTKAIESARNLRNAEQLRRKSFPTRLHRSADAYLVRGRNGKTIIAGYPWFTDWGRDTFISLRGLCLATGRLDEACEILTAWVPAVSQGMLPNRFPDHGQAPDYNSVDASLWYIVAVHDYFETSRQQGATVAGKAQALLRDTVLQILNGYYRGTRYGIRGDDDGLLAAGVAGTQLTWMDARVGDRVVTPRIGKPVEVQALWLNALKIGASFDKQWLDVHDRGLKSFRARFWNAARGCLYDVVDVDHQKGTVDDSLRPNQIFAVGGLPWMLLEEGTARQVVDAVESRLLTPMGLRTLEPGVAGYAGRSVGGVHERDSTYHQGTVWPWLIGPFVEAWIRVHGGTKEARCEALERFLGPLFEQLDQGGLGHLAELADGDPPYTPRGCPFQAWSLGEFIRARQIAQT